MDNFRGTYAVFHLKTCFEDVREENAIQPRADSRRPPGSCGVAADTRRRRPKTTLPRVLCAGRARAARPAPGGRRSREAEARRRRGSAGPRRGARVRRVLARAGAAPLGTAGAGSAAAAFARPGGGERRDEASIEVAGRSAPPPRSLCAAPLARAEPSLTPAPNGPAAPARGLARGSSGPARSKHNSTARRAGPVLPLHGFCRPRRREEGSSGPAPRRLWRSGAGRCSASRGLGRRGCWRGAWSGGRPRPCSAGTAARPGLRRARRCPLWGSVPARDLPVAGVTRPRDWPAGTSPSAERAARARRTLGAGETPACSPFQSAPPSVEGTACRGCPSFLLPLSPGLRSPAGAFSGGRWSTQGTFSSSSFTGFAQS